MSEEYVPTTRELQDAWAYWATKHTDITRAEALSSAAKTLTKIKADAWQEGYDEFERAHKMSNYEPWEYAGDNPYKTK